MVQCCQVRDLQGCVGLDLGAATDSSGRTGLTHNSTQSLKAKKKMCAASFLAKLLLLQAYVVSKHY
jgi:hypothetical protein